MKYDIWMEGYAATCEHGTAQKITKEPIEAENFDEAVKKYMELNPKHGIKANGLDSYISEAAYKKRSSNWNIWACNLYSNEEDARKSFG